MERSLYDKEKIIEMVKAYGTGGLPESKSLGDEAYGEIYLKPFEDMRFVRSTKERFKDFGIDTLGGKTVIEVGCHIGALSFFAHQLGAEKVIGYDTNEDRIKTAIAIQEYNEIPGDKMVFTAVPPIGLSADLVICCAVDDYVKKEERAIFYDFLLSLTKDRFVIESNVQEFLIHPLYYHLTSNGIPFTTDGGKLDHVYKHGRIRHLFIGKLG